MAKFKIATPAGASFTIAGGGYDHEMEPLEGLDAEIVEGPADEDGFITFAQDADAIYAKGMRFTKKVVDGLPDEVSRHRAWQRRRGQRRCRRRHRARHAGHQLPRHVHRGSRRPRDDAAAGGASAAPSSRTAWCAKARWREGRPALLQIPRLMGQTLGLIAFGHVARAVAKRAKPFGLRMIAYDPFIEELVMVEHGVIPCTLEEVLSQSDFVSMHAPATPEAEGMLMEKHFRLMKKTAIFINTGRGPTVQESALIKALQERWIAHAGLDVLEIEPPGNNNPILRMANVILSAHTASASARFDPARKRHVGRELALVLNGKWPMSCVNPAVLHERRTCAAGSLCRWSAARTADPRYVPLLDRWRSDPAGETSDVSAWRNSICFAARSASPIAPRR